MDRLAKPAEQNQQTLEAKVRSASGWLFAIAVFTAVNSINYILRLTDGYFVIGLGLTQFVEGVAPYFVTSFREGTIPIAYFLAFLVNAYIIFAFVVFGYFARRKLKAAFILGGGIYLLDIALLLYSEDYLGAAFHLWGLAAIVGGYRSLDSLSQLEADGDPDIYNASGSGPAPAPLPEWANSAFWAVSGVLILVLVGLGGVFAFLLLA